MKKLLWSFLCVCVPTLVWAGPTGPKQDFSSISYGFSNVTFNAGLAQEARIDRRHWKKTIKFFSPVAAADAAVEPNGFQPQNFPVMYGSLQNASRLEDLRPVLSAKYFEALEARVKAGASQYSVLAMLEAMRPQKIQVNDLYSDGDQAKLAVSGRSHFGPMQGLIDLSRTEGVWKIEHENWSAGDRDKREPIDEAFRAPAGLQSIVSPDFVLNKNRLSLIKIPHSRRNRAITFVFIMNKDKNAARAEAGRKRMHVMVPGVKKIMTEQMLFERQYPVDVSVAKSEDGYAPDEWNLELPHKKPREVDVSLLWSF